LSNTALLYERDWTGLNVDAMPGSMDLFRQYRGRDINVETAIADRPGTLTYVMFEFSSLNGLLSSEQIKQHTDERDKN
jgi:hypothetical protein